MNQKSRVSSKGQVTLPIEARKALSITPGDQVEFEVMKDNIVVRPVRSALDAIYQSIPGLKKRHSDEELIRLAADEHLDHVAREGMP